jgi:ABC-type transport system substrate-binding protein
MQIPPLFSPLKLVMLTLAVSAVCSACVTATSLNSKTLYQVMAPGKYGFDPARHGDSTSRQLQEAVFDRLLTYDYLARPAKLVPAAAVALPGISNEGKTFTVQIAPQTMFATDVVLANKSRELVAGDIAYSLTRHADPANSSPSRSLFVGKILGLDTLEQAARLDGKFDATTKVRGLEVVDRYTLRIHLAETDYDFPYVLAHPSASIVAREMFDTPIGADHVRPIGSGPYQLEKWISDEKITLVANPQFRTSTRDAAARDRKAGRDVDSAATRQIQRVEISIENDRDRRWQQFTEGNVDILDRLDSATTARAITNGKLSPALSATGINLHMMPEPEIIYYYINLRDPVLGGYSTEQKALRRAILQSFDVEAEIRDIRKGLGRIAYSPVPPGVNGHDPIYRSSLTYNLIQANKTLDEHGFRRGADGWRMTPNGKPLVVTFSSEPLDVVKPYAALRMKGLEQIGIKMETRMQSFQQNLVSAEKCELAYWGSTWRATVPTANYFLQLLSSKNVNKGNLACYESDAFDALFEEAKKLPDGPARSAIYVRMARLIEEDGVWQLGTNRVSLALVKPRVIGYVPHPMLHSLWQYLDLQEPNPGAPR